MALTILSVFIQLLIRIPFLVSDLVDNLCSLQGRKNNMCKKKNKIKIIKKEAINFDSGLACCMFL